MLDSSDVQSSSLERQRIARAQLAELELQQQLRSWAPIDTVRNALRRLEQPLRQAGERLQQLYGTEAQEILDEAIDDAVESAASELTDGEDQSQSADGNGAARSG